MLWRGCCWRGSTPDTPLLMAVWQWGHRLSWGLSFPADTSWCHPPSLTFILVLFFNSGESSSYSYLGFFQPHLWKLMCCHWMHHQLFSPAVSLHQKLIKRGKKSTRLGLGESVQHFSWREFSYPYLNCVKKEKVTRQDNNPGSPWPPSKGLWGSKAAAKAKIKLELCLQGEKNH